MIKIIDFDCKGIRHYFANNEKNLSFHDTKTASEVFLRPLPAKDRWLKPIIGATG